MQAFHNALPPHTTWLFHQQFETHPKYRAITIAVLEVDSQLVATGVSHCSLADNFCKKKWNAIATGRAEKLLGVGFGCEPVVGGLHAAKHVADRITADCLIRGKR